MKKERGVPLRRRPIKAICIPGTFAAIAKLAYRQLWLTLKITRENGMWSTIETGERVGMRHTYFESILLFSRDLLLRSPERLWRIEKFETRLLPSIFSFSLEIFRLASTDTLFRFCFLFDGEEDAEPRM